ncbi:MAG: ABC transporter substrate-binding protein [Acidimicrobiales bacterium]
MSGTKLIAVLLAAGLLIAACGDTEASPTETITVFAPYRGRSAELFQASLKSFADDNNVQIRYTGTSDFVNDLRSRVGEANPPDIAVVPQPGVIRQFWEDGRLVPLQPVAVAAVEENYSEESRELGKIDGVPVGVLYRANVKSLVWYRPSVFAERGYSVPGTLDELKQLSARIAADGLAPWCITIQARGATGWVATDWVEDLLVRTSGAELYSSWVNGEVQFSAPAVAQVFDEFAALALVQGRPYGGLERVLRTSVDKAQDPMFNSPPDCVMHRQASFAAGWLPGGVSYGDPDSDLDIFVLPGAQAGEPAPLLVGGDHAIAFTDRPIVHELLAFMATTESSEVWSAEGAYFSPRTSLHADSHRNPLEQLLGELMANAETIVFDGSDQMDPDFSTDLFWPLITAWVAGDISYDELARQLDEARELN